MDLFGRISNKVFRGARGGKIKTEEKRWGERWERQEKYREGGETPIERPRG